MSELERLLEQSGAVMRGHFILTSGRHSDVYFEKFRVLERPDVLSALCADIATRFRPLSPDFVAGPTTGGIIIAFEVARQIGVPAVYVEAENGARTLRRGKALAPGARALIVDDVLTTGRSLIETRDALISAGAEVIGYAALIDRSESLPELGAPLHAVHRVDACSWAEDELPPSLRETPAVKLGTRI